MKFRDESNFELNKVLNNELYKMSNINRFTGRLIIKNENLAEHSFYVAFKVLELGNQFNIKEEIINKAVKMALCHDCGEIYTSDLPYMIKKNNPELNKVIEDLELKEIKNNFTYMEKYFKDFITKKDKQAYLLVEAADSADVLMFINREEALGNKDEELLAIKAGAQERYLNAIIKLKETL